jgi:hypothetical protein
MIRTYQGFNALKNGIGEFPPAGGLYTKPKIDRITIMDAEYVVIPSMEIEECTDEKGGYIPLQLEGKGYHEWLEAAMVKEVIRRHLEHNPQASIADIVDAVFYYLEHDTFKDA